MLTSRWQRGASVAPQVRSVQIQDWLQIRPCDPSLRLGIDTGGTFTDFVRSGTGRSRRPQGPDDAGRSGARHSGRRRGRLARGRSAARRRNALATPDGGRSRLDGRDERRARTKGRAGGARGDGRLRGRARGSAGRRGRSSTTSSSRCRARLSNPELTFGLAERLDAGGDVLLEPIDAGRRRARRRSRATSGADIVARLPAALLRESGARAARGRAAPRAGLAGVARRTKCCPSTASSSAGARRSSTRTSRRSSIATSAALERRSRRIAAVDHAVERRVDFRGRGARRGRAHGAVRAGRRRRRRATPSRARPGVRG